MLLNVILYICNAIMQKNLIPFIMNATTKKTEAQKVQIAENLNKEKNNFLARIEALKTQQLENAKKLAEKKVKRSEKTLSLKNAVLLHILNSGENGVTISQIMELPTFSEKKPNFNINTVNRDWNKNPLKISENGENEEIMQTVQTELLENEIEFFVFNLGGIENHKFTALRKCNNLIIVAPNSVEKLKNYLLANGAKPEQILV